MSDENVISVKLVADAHDMEASLADMMQNAKATLAELRAQIRSTNAELKIADPAERLRLRPIKQALEWDAAKVQEGIKQLETQWEQMRLKIEGATAALRKFGAAAETGKTIGGYSLPPDLLAEAKGKVEQARAQIREALSVVPAMIGTAGRIDDFGQEALANPVETLRKGRLKEEQARAAVPLVVEEPKRPAVSTKEAEALEYLRAHDARFQDSERTAGFVGRRFGLDEEAARRVYEQWAGAAPEAKPSSGVQVFSAPYTDQGAPGRFVMAAHPEFTKEGKIPRGLLEGPYAEAVQKALAERGLKPENLVGTADFLPTEDYDPSTGKPPARYYSAGTDVEPEFQRKGIATAMYNHAEEVTGAQVVPAAARSDEGTAFWNAGAHPRNPSLIRARESLTPPQSTTDLLGDRAAASDEAHSAREDYDAASARENQARSRRDSAHSDLAAARQLTDNPQDLVPYEQELIAAERELTEAERVRAEAQQRVIETQQKFIESDRKVTKAGGTPLVDENQKEAAAIRAAKEQETALVTDFANTEKQAAQDAADSVTANIQRETDATVSGKQQAGEAAQASARNQTEAATETAEATRVATETTKAQAAETQKAGNVFTRLQQTAQRAFQEIMQGQRESSQATASEAAQLAVLKQRREQLYAEKRVADRQVRDATANLAMVELHSRRAIEEGDRQALEGLTRYRNELEQARQKQLSFAAAIEETNAQIRKLGSSGGGNNFYATSAKAREEVAALDGSIGGVQYSLARLMARFEALTPIINAAFAPLAALGLVEILVDMGEKVHNLYLNWVELKQAKEEALDVDLKLQKATDEAYDKQQGIEGERLKRQGRYAEAVDKDRNKFEATPIDLEKFLSRKEVDEKFKHLPAEVQESFKQAFQNITPGQLASKIAEVKQQFEDAQKAAKAMEEAKEQALSPAAITASGGASGLSVIQADHTEQTTSRIPTDILGQLLGYLRQQEQTSEKERQELERARDEAVAKELIEETERRNAALREAAQVTAVSPTASVAPGSLTLPQAMARAEGYGANPDNIPTRNNNPGDIEFGDFAKQYGATKDEKSRFAKFPDAETGWKAMKDLLASSAYSNLTLAQAIEKWNGHGANSPDYIQSVSRDTGMAPNAPIASAVRAPAIPGGAARPDTAAAELQNWVAIRDRIPENSPERRQVDSKIAELAQRARTESVRKMREADENELADREADHRMDTEELIRFWEGKLALESQYAERYREIHNRLGHLKQQRAEEQETRDIAADRRTSEAMLTPEGKPDRGAQLDYWNDKLADLRTKAMESVEKHQPELKGPDFDKAVQEALEGNREYKAALDEVARTAAENVRQIDQDLVKADQEGLEARKRDHKVSVDEEAIYWAQMEAKEKKGGAGAADALKAAQDKLADAIQRLIAQQQRIKEIEENIARMNAELPLQKQEEVVEGAHKMGIGSDKLGQMVGVSVPKTPKASIKDNLLSLGVDNSAEVQQEKELQSIHEREHNETVDSLNRDIEAHRHEKETVARLEEQLAREHARYERQKLHDTIQVATAIEKEWEKRIKAITHAFFSGLNSWIAHQRTFGQAMKQSWNDIVMSVIQQLEQMAETFIAKEIAMLIVKKLFGQQSKNTDKEQQQSAKQTAMALTGEAADAVMASIMVAVPWPANFPLAVSMGAATEAIGTTFANLAQADTGGFIPHDGIAMLHKGEVVVNNPITSMLGKMAAGGNLYSDAPALKNPALFSSGPGSAANSGSIQHVANDNRSSTGPTHVHVKYSPTIHGGSTNPGDLKKLLSDHADHIGAIVRKQSKAFNR